MALLWCLLLALLSASAPAQSPWELLPLGDDAVTEGVERWGSHTVPDLNVSEDAKVGSCSVVGTYGFTHRASASAGEARSWNLTGYETLRFWARADRPNGNVLCMLCGRDLENRRDAPIALSEQWRLFELPLDETTFCQNAQGDFSFTRVRSIALYNNSQFESRIWLDGLEAVGSRPPEPVVDEALALPPVGDPRRLAIAPTDPEPHLSQALAQRQQVKARYYPPPLGFNPENAFDDPLVSFEHAADWTAVLSDATGYGCLSQDQSLRGVPNLKLEIAADAKTPRITLLPPEPVRIKSDFDIVECWVYAHKAGGSIAFHFRRPDGSPVVVGRRCGEVLADASPEPLHEFWNLARLVLPGTLEAGTELVAIHLRPNLPESYDDPTYVLHLDQLRVGHFATEMQRPAPVFANTGPAAASLPVSPGGACPQSSEPVRAFVRHAGNSYRFRYITADGEDVTYRYTPGNGTLSDLSIRPRGKSAFRPAVGSGPVFSFSGTDFDASGPGCVAQVVSQKLQDGVLTITWRYSTHKGSQDITYRISLAGKTLRIAVDSEQRDVCRWTFGEAHGVRDARVIEVPYMLYCPNVLLTHGLFVSFYSDWYESNVSTLPYGAMNHVAGQVARYNWRSDQKYAYYPLTDGRRHPLREVFYITAAEDFDDVMLTVSNPPSPMKQILGKRLFRMVLAATPGIFRRARAFVDLCDGYGISDYYFLFHGPLFFRRYGSEEPFPGDLHVSALHEPEGGDEGLAELFAYMRSKGVLPGYYDGYPSRDPTSAYFRREWTSYRPDGKWNTMWRAPALKPWAFPELAATLYRERARRFSPGVSYQDGITAWIISNMSDFDHRDPEAGTLRGTIEALATGWQRVRENVGGPVFSEGRGSDFFTAGLNDGDYSKLKGYWDDKPCDQDRVELLVDFRLKKLGPLSSPVSVNIGYAGFAATNDISYESYYAAEDSYNYLHHFLATQIAFATIGMLEPYWPLWEDPRQQFDKTMSCYFLMRQLQERYLMEPVTEVKYFDGERLLTTGDALRADVVKRNQVLIGYQNGLRVHVNLNWDGASWPVEDGGETYDLPPGGWLAVQGEDFLEFSATLDGRRVDFVDSPDYTYLDPHGVPIELGGIRTDRQTVRWKTGPHNGELLYGP